MLGNIYDPAKAILIINHPLVIPRNKILSQLIQRILVSLPQYITSDTKAIQMKQHRKILRNLFKYTVSQLFKKNLHFIQILTLLTKITGCFSILAPLIDPPWMEIIMASVCSFSSNYKFKMQWMDSPDLKNISKWQDNLHSFLYRQFKQCYLHIAWAGQFYLMFEH